MTDSELMQLSEKVGRALQAQGDGDHGGILHRWLDSESHHRYCRQLSVV